MKCRGAAGLWVLFAFASVLQAAQSPPALSVEEYRADLDRLVSATDRLGTHPEEAKALARTVPSEWTVRSEGRSFQVPGFPVQDRLREFATNADSATLASVHDHLLQLRTGAEGYTQPNGIGPGREQLNSILSRDDFRDVKGQTWQDRLRDWLFRNVVRVLSLLFGSSSFPIIGEIIVYGLVALAVALLGLWVYRAIRRESRAEQAALDFIIPVSAKDWTLWLAEARAAADRGDWANAVHLAYWAGISFLETQGAWPPDQARTPREYLRLLPASSGQAPALTDLTQRFEVVWYGRQTAGAESFHATLTCLEKLGCR